MSTGEAGARDIGRRDREDAWQLLLQLAARARAGRPVVMGTGLALRGTDWVEASGEQKNGAKPELAAEVWIESSEIRTLDQVGHWNVEAEAMLALLGPLVTGARATKLVVGHLGQSLDGRVATPTGASRFITGREDVIHTHRLRALCDAVLVGVRTVLLDDPQLTTRLVTGAHPVRVVLDPQARLDTGCRLLEDGAVETLICTRPDRMPKQPRRGHVEWFALPCEGSGFPIPMLLASLRARGLMRIFVEGGGITISRFLQARALDRLHVSVAPMILGSGAPAFALPPIDRLEEALTPQCRHFSLGPDLLFDCAFEDGLPAEFCSPADPHASRSRARGRAST